MAEAAIDVSAVQNVLDGFLDPETGRSVVKMNQLGRIDLENNKLTVELGLTTLVAPLWEETRTAAENRLRDAFAGLDSVHVKLSQHHRPSEKMGEVGLTAKCLIAVGSGKGGVGKSTLAASLAIGLKRSGCKVGLLDADFYGPSIPHLLGVEGTPYQEENEVIPVDLAGMPVMSIGFLVAPDQAVVWRGPMLHNHMQMFVGKTRWGDLDYLIVDMPPGTGDIALSLSQMLPVTGAVIVCTPQAVALLDAVKAISMLRTVKIPVLGMVENMSGFICPDCDRRYEIFGSGGAKLKAEELEVPFLGEVPINPSIRSRGDEGKVADIFDDHLVAPYLDRICYQLVKNIVDAHAAEPPLPKLTVL